MTHKVRLSTLRLSDKDWQANSDQEHGVVDQQNHSDSKNSLANFPFHIDSGMISAKDGEV